MSNLVCPECEDELYVDATGGESVLVCASCDWEGPPDDADREDDDLDPAEEDIPLEGYNDEDEDYDL